MKNFIKINSITVGVLLIGLLVGFSHVSATTLLSESFSGTTINTANWVETDSSGAGGTTGNIQQNNGLKLQGISQWGTNSLKTAQTYNRTSDLTAQMDVTITDCSSSNLSVPAIGYGDEALFGSGKEAYTVYYYNGSLRFAREANSNNVEIAGVNHACTDNTPFHLKLVVLAEGGAQIYVDNDSSPLATLTGGTFQGRPFFLQGFGSNVTTINNFTLSGGDLPESPLNQPSDLVVEPADGQAQLSWTSPAANGGSASVDYIIEYKLSTASTWSIFSDGVSVLTSALVTGLTNGVSYDFRVSAVSAPSDAVSATPAEDSTPPPTNDPDESFSDDFTGTTIDSLKWNEVDSAAGGAGGTAGNVRQNNSLTVSGIGSWAGQNGVSTVRTFDRTSGDVSMILTIKRSACGQGVAPVVFGYGDLDFTTGSSASYIGLSNGTSWEIYYWSGGANQSGSPQTFSGFTSCTDNAPFTIKLTALSGGGAKVYVNDSANPNAVISGGTFTNKSFWIGSYAAHGVTEYTDLKIYTPTSEPVAPVASSVNVAGHPNINETLEGRYAFSDANGDAQGASTYQWSHANTLDGVYSPITGATSPLYALTASDEGTYLKFEVVPVSAVAPTTGTAVTSLAVGPVGGQISYINQVVSTGQSLSVGYGGSPALSTTQPYNNLMLSGTSLVPLVEDGVETMGSALANTITANVSGNNYDIAVTNNGVSSFAYFQLKKGTTPYAQGIAQVTSVKNAAATLGESSRVIGVTTIHGETDNYNGVTGPAYEEYLREWQADYQADIQAITGQTTVIPLFTDQMSSYAENAPTSQVPIYQLAASEDYPGKIVLVTPKYFLNYSDPRHLTNESYRWLGEYYGKVIKKVAVDHQAWRPLSPDQVTRSGNAIYVKFHVPAGTLEFDTTLEQSKANYGFEYYDDSASASISSVEIVSSDTVKITLNTTPTGNNQRIRYAYTGTAGASAGSHSTGAAGGNLRDTDSYPSLYGNTLYNWAVHFDKAVSTE